MKKLRNIVLFSAFVLISASSFGQMETVQPRFGLGLHGGVPVDEYAEATDGVGAGVNLSLSIPIVKGIPIYAGLEFGYLMFGRNTQRENLTAEISVGNTVIDRIDMPLRITTSNNAYLWHLTLRAQAPIPIVQPYVQGMAGFRYMNTKTAIYDDSYDNRWSEADNGLIVEQTQLFDFVGSAGFGVGIMVPVSPFVMIDARVDQLYGGKAQYYDAEDTAQWEVEFVAEGEFDPNQVDGNDLSFSTQPKESFTNMTTFTLGISVLLGSNSNR